MAPFQFETKYAMASGGRTVTFKNRLIRSALGGRMAYYDGTANNAWKNFEYDFAKAGVGGIISATMSVNPARHSPLEYPQIDDDKFIAPLQDGVGAVQSLDCRYIMQIGDPGYHTQTSLFSRPAESHSSSGGVDGLFGFRNRRSAMTLAQIQEQVEFFVRAADRVKRIGCDGVELTASKGYLLHQFLNPAVNRRRDRYGSNRFLMLEEVVRGIRDVVGRDYLFGVKLSARDFARDPWNVRWPPFGRGNTLKETLVYARRLKELGVDYLHVTNGFGFICPSGNPGDFPVPEAKIFFDSTRHLSTKAALRATVMHTPLQYLARYAWNRLPPGCNLPDATQFASVGLPVIVNGGFQDRDLIERALQTCQFVSVARPLLANRDLFEILKKQPKPDNACSFCNRCAVRTTLFPLGCYDVKRFNDDFGAMERQIIATSANPVWPPAQQMHAQGLRLA